MNTATFIALLGITAAIAWGISDFFAAHSAKKVGPILAATVINTVSTIIFSLTFVVFFRDHTALTASGFYYSIAAGAVLTVATALFFTGLQAGPVSIVSPLSSTYPLVTTLVAVVLFGAHLSIREVSGILLTCGGIVAASGLLNTSKSERKLTGGIRFALATAVLWGIGWGLLAQAINQIDWQLASLLSSVTAALTLILLLPFIKGLESSSWQTIKVALKSRYVLLAAVIQLIGSTALEIGISRSRDDNGAVVTAISAAYPILTVFLALRYFKERVAFISIVGAILGIVGVVILSLG
ncbi:DMT family transporter [Polaromonas sp.]|nr:DMT family transporter [Candidatus Saccharibacteria bacterium]